MERYSSDLLLVVLFFSFPFDRYYDLKFFMSVVVEGFVSVKNVEIVRSA